LRLKVSKQHLRVKRRRRAAQPELYAIKSGTIEQEIPAAAHEITAARRIIFAPESS
jgi:hypothetical protein